jgi:hypothetical protein
MLIIGERRKKNDVYSSGVRRDLKFRNIKTAYYHDNYHDKNVAVSGREGMVVWKGAGGVCVSYTVRGAVQPAVR